MEWSISRNHKDEAKKLNLKVVGGILVVDLDSIPSGINVDEFLDNLIKKGVLLKRRTRFRIKRTHRNKSKKNPKDKFLDMNSGMEQR